MSGAVALAPPQVADGIAAAGGGWPFVGQVTPKQKMLDDKKPFAFLEIVAAQQVLGIEEPILPN